jgi:hypothetical protein
MGRTETYVIGLLEDLLGPKDAIDRFDWALGDLSPRTGRAVRLPFDAVWVTRRLIVEVDEEQHQKATPIFDKPDVLTVSGVHRGIQRQIYDERKRQAARAQGYTVVEITWPRRRKPDPADIVELRSLLREAGLEDLVG